MATLQHADSRRLYSWWWDSHISPKNSRWLQENLTDMDAKVKAMIKLIEEDADSFARRAEMYYKKRPELMKLVEEFYRAYRALAERYDHATVELRHAHRTISEAFPNQMPFSLADDSPSGSSTTEAEPHTPEMPHPIRALLDPDDLQKDALGLSSSHFHAVKRNVPYSEESDTSTGKKGLKELNEMFGSVEVAPHANSTEGKVRKGLKFHESEGNEQGLQEGSHISTETQYLKAKVLSECETSSKAENEIQTLKVALNKLKAEKDSGLLQYQQSLERLSNLEAEISHMREEAKGLDKRATKAETEVQNLEEALAKVEAERKAVLLQYQQCMDTISNLEAKISLAQDEAEGLNERASQAEIEAQTLKQSLSRLEAEKDSGLLQYNQCLETISSLENKILHAEEDARGLNERADKAEKEAETLNQALDILNKEKEAAALQYQKCLETISKLETEISHARDEAKRLNGEVEMGVAKLNSAEKHCLLLEKSNQSLQSEVDSLLQKMEVQNQELSKKQQELEKLMICIQEEHLRFVQAEASLQTLHGLHSQSQEEHRALALQLQNGIQLLKDMEIHNHGLEEEFRQVKDENKNLKELNLSSAMSIKNLQDEIHSLREMKGKLEEEVEFRMDQRNALQQEIYCLKEEINDLNRKHRGIVEEVKSVGLDPECLGSSVKDLQDENAKLQEMCQNGREDKLALLEKLEIMEKLSEKNSLLENSLSDANAELEGLREKIKTLEESCQSLLEENSCLVPEKAALVSQLEIVSQNMEKLLEKNSFLENSLCDANAELDGLREKSKSLEESCQLLENEKSGLITERDTMVSQLKMIQQRLEHLEERYTDLEERFSRLEEEKESTDTQVQELRVSLDTEKQEHANFAQSSEARLACMEKQICHLQEEGQWMKKEFEEELEKAVNAQIEIFILQKFMQDLEEKNFSLLIECEKHFEASKLSEKVITELEHENLEQQLDLKSLLNQIQKLRTGIGMVLKALETDPDCECGDKTEEDQRLLQHVLGAIEDMKNSLLSTQDEKQQMVLEKSILVTFLGQLRSEAGALETERNTLDQEKKLRTDQLLMVQGEKQEILEMSEHLRLKVMEGAHREEALKAELENLLAKLSDLQGAYVLLQYENSEVLKENTNFVKELSELKDEKCTLEEENSTVLTEALALSNLSLILKNFGTEKAMELEGLTKDVEVLHVVNGDIENKVGMLEQNLGMVQRENLHLKESVEQLEKELCSTRNDNDQLNYQTAVGKDLLSQKEAEISEAEQKLKATEREKIELLENVLDLKRGYNDAEIIKEELGKKILKLSEDNTNQKKEIEHLHELNGRIESELSKLREDCEEHKTREESLSSKLCERRAEAELWEACAATFYEDLQLSKIGETLFEEKVHELTRAIESLENEGTSKTVETNYLKERVSSLEEENGELKAHLAAYFPVISSLGNTITSLEQHALLRKKLSTTDSQEPRGTEDSNHMHDLSSHGLREDQSSVVPDGLLKMRELQTKVQTVEKAVMEIERLIIQEKLDSNVKLEVAVKQIEELKDQSNLHQENVHRRDIVKQTEEDELDQNLKLQKTEPEISRVKNGFLMKDIPLDQISDCSPYMISKKENGEADDQMLELWETAEQFYRLNPPVGEEEKLASASTKDNDEFHQIEAVAEQQSEYNSSELQVEKELGVDKLELSKRVPHQDVNKRKILERLESDAQKLVNLQINVQDLKSKVEMSEKSRKGKGIEYDTVKEQLQEAEEDIMKLVNFNGKLVKKLEDSPIPSDGNAGGELEETRNVRCRRISEQARRTFEKIGRLQIEVQKIQFLLLKLEDEKESKWRTRFSQRKARVHLRDFMYTGKGDQKRKKGPFCACVKPQTKGD